MAHTWWHGGSGDSGGILGFDFFGGSNAGPKPQWDDPQFGGGQGMTDRQWRRYQQDRADWEEMKNLQDQRQAMFQEMAQTTGPTAKEWTSRAGKMEAGDPFSPIQVAGGPAPSDVMARYGRPKKWPYLQSIVNMGKLA